MIRMLTLLALGWSGQAVACEVIRDAVVHTPDGPQDGWDVHIDGSTIRAVGADLVVPSGCTERQAPGGAHVTPGLVAVGTRLGLVEVSLEPSTRDDGSDTDDPIRAGMRVIEGFNPASSLIRITRMGGITQAVVHASGGFVSGQAGGVTLADYGPETYRVLPFWSERTASVAMDLHIGQPGSFPAGMMRLRELLDDAVAWSKRRDPYSGLSELSASRLDLEAMAAVSAGELPLIVHVDRASDIEAVMSLAESRNLRVILAGGAEAWMHAEALSRLEIPVIVDPLVYGVGSFDQLQGRPDNAALLARAGVRVMLSDGSTHNARSLRLLAGNAVRGGMDHTSAIRAVTQTPCEVFSLGDCGAIRRGGGASLALWSGDPLEISSRLRGLYVDGARVTLTSRQTELVDAWRDVPKRFLPADY